MEAEGEELEQLEGMSVLIGDPIKTPLRELSNSKRKERIRASKRSITASKGKGMKASVRVLNGFNQNFVLIGSMDGVWGIGCGVWGGISGF